MAPSYGPAKYSRVSAGRLRLPVYWGFFSWSFDSGLIRSQTQFPFASRRCIITHSGTPSGGTSFIFSSILGSPFQYIWFRPLNVKSALSGGSLGRGVCFGFALALRGSEIRPYSDEGNDFAACPFPHRTLHKGRRCLDTNPLRLLLLSTNVFQWISFPSPWTCLEERHAAR